MGIHGRGVGLLLCAVGLPSLLACLEHPLKPVDLNNEGEKGENVQLSVNKDVDVLFVIDNSGSMATEQATLANNFEAFIQVLEREDVQANYRIGITTTDDGNPWHCNTAAHSGALRKTSCLDRPNDFDFRGNSAFTEACENICDHASIELLPTSTHLEPAPESRPWLESIGGVTNLPDGISTVEAFQCLGPQGISGCGFESHLESMYKMLRRSEDSEAPEYGFRRPGAILAVIFVTDEADCSGPDDAQFGPAWTRDGNHVFWSQQNIANGPTSEVCWNAGVICQGDGPQFEDCVAANKAVDGTPSEGDAAVLFPVDRYVALLQEIEDQKRTIDENHELLVAVIGGVPQGYAEGEAQLVYREAPGTQFHTDNGIAPGCSSTAGEAVPPVRMREFAAAFEVDRPNLHSVCAADYAPALEAIADAIADQVRPACMPQCVADVDPVAEGLQPRCDLEEQWTDAAGDAQMRDVPPCVTTAEGWDFPTPGDEVCYRGLTDPRGATATAVDDMSATCAAEGWNLEFSIERRDEAPAPSGTRVAAKCTVSTRRSLDCPDL